MEFETSKGVKVVSSFDAMGLREDLLRGIYQFGFEKPSAIQQRAILPIVQVGPAGGRVGPTSGEEGRCPLLRHAAGLASACQPVPPGCPSKLARPGGPACSTGPRRDRAGAIRHRQDKPDCHHAVPDAGHHAARVSTPAHRGRRAPINGAVLCGWTTPPSRCARRAAWLAARGPASQLAAGLHCSVAWGEPTGVSTRHWHMAGPPGPPRATLPLLPHAGLPPLCCAAAVDPHLACCLRFPASAPCRVQALVLSPTRELATQTTTNVLAIGDHMSVQVRPFVSPLALCAGAGAGWGFVDRGPGGGGGGWGGAGEIGRAHV